VTTLLNLPMRVVTKEPGPARCGARRFIMSVFRLWLNNPPNTAQQAKCSAAWWGMTHHHTAQHSIAQHSTAQHSTAQHSTAQHSTAQRALVSMDSAQTWHMPMHRKHQSELNPLQIKKVCRMAHAASTAMNIVLWLMISNAEEAR